LYHLKNTKKENIRKGRKIGRVRGWGGEGEGRVVVETYLP
jgi:hypothetical protein